MLKNPILSTLDDDHEIVKRLLKRYAARYYLSGPDQNALVAQTLTALADDPDLLSVSPLERAVASVMHGLFQKNLEQLNRQSADGGLRKEPEPT